MRAKLLVAALIALAACAAILFWFYQNTHAKEYAKGIIQTPSVVLPQDDSRTNIVLLGVGGEGHEGGDLTDSILIASIYHPTNKITLISIPRDVWLESAKSKINAIYYYSNQKSPPAGFGEIKSALTEITGLPIHYALLVDFSGFIKAIDAVGGVNVTVERTFDDYKYPIPGRENAEPESERYEHLHFDAGPTHMDGVMALKYVRSRHALGEEGTDFARSVRQQKVIKAFFASLISTSTVFNSERITTLENVLKGSIKTDIPDTMIAPFTKLGLATDLTNISSITIESQLVNPKNLQVYGGQWVLIPTKSWQDIQAYVQANLAK